MPVAPKRDEERARRNTPESGAARHGEMRPVKQVNADRKNWHPRAVTWFDSLKSSGQQDYFQDSDWAMAKIIADYLTAWYDRPRAMDMANILVLMAKLGTTEADRRQLLRIELDPPTVEEKSLAVVAIDSYRDRMKQRASNQ